jgi:hypothetical protein
MIALIGISSKHLMALNTEKHAGLDKCCPAMDILIQIEGHQPRFFFFIARFCWC